MNQSNNQGKKSDNKPPHQFRPSELEYQASRRQNASTIDPGAHHIKDKRQSLPAVSPRGGVGGHSSLLNVYDALTLDDV
jgi:hypothetical protein